MCEKFDKDHQAGEGPGDQQGPVSTEEDERDRADGGDQDQPGRDRAAPQEGRFTPDGESRDRREASGREQGRAEETP